MPRKQIKGFFFRLPTKEEIFTIVATVIIGLIVIVMFIFRS